MILSPYAGCPQDEWPEITKALVEDFPINMADIVKVVEAAWSDLFNLSIGESGLRVGADIFLPAQATGVILERLIGVEMRKRFQGWRSGLTKTEKDIVCENDLRFSFEIKTSSSRTGLYGNRSTGHRAEGRIKFRTGYYLVVNYKLPTETDPDKKLYNLRFGWIDDEDWIGQAKPTGQQASIGVKLARLKLINLKSAT